MRPASKKRGGGGVEVELAIECADDGTATALSATLMPDNRYFPKDQTFVSSLEGRTIRCVVRSPRTRPALSTVASIISDAKLFGDLWLEARTRGLGPRAER